MYLPFEQSSSFHSYSRTSHSVSRPHPLEHRCTHHLHVQSGVLHKYSTRFAFPHFCLTCSVMLSSFPMPSLHQCESIIVYHRPSINAGRSSDRWCCRPILLHVIIPPISTFVPATAAAIAFAFKCCPIMVHLRNRLHQA
jgi:hypothetical protein